MKEVPARARRDTSYVTAGNYYSIGVYRVGGVRHEYKISRCNDGQHKMGKPLF